MYEITSKKVDGAILVFESIHPKWSYVKSDKNGFIREVAEKKVISKEATVGVYYWKRGEDYVHSAEKMIKKNIRVNNEFYVCPVYTFAIQNNYKIGIYEIPKNHMHGLGTPEDLEIFINKDKN
jgi:hypothetical protein